MLYQTSTLTSDISHGFRILAKNPVFAIGAILTLALAIGANTAMFTLVNTVLLRQLPFRQPESLVWIWSTRTDRDKAFFSIPDFLEHQSRNRTLEAMGVYANWAPNLTGFGQAERFTGVRFTANALEFLGAKPVAGRLILPEDDRPSADPVVVLSYGLWVRRFGRDPAILGSKLTLNDAAYRVIGVLDPGFLMPAADVELATVLSPQTDPRRAERGANFLRAFGRLRPGITRAQAQADLDSITSDLRRRFPETNAKHTTPRVLPFDREIVGNYSTALTVLLAAVALLLLVACSNLANLLLARGSARQKDIAVRAALGATRTRISVQLMTESLVPAFLGGALGLILAQVGVKTLSSFLPVDLPRAQDIAMDARVMLFTAGISMLAAVIFGLIPALQLSRTDLTDRLKTSAWGSTVSSRGKLLRSVFVVSQLSLSFILLIGLGLFLKSFSRLQSVNPGFDPHGVFHVRISLPPSRYQTPESVKVFYGKLHEKLALLPGVETVGAANALPLSGLNNRNDFSIVGDAPATRADLPAAQYRVVSAGFLRAMKIPLLRGREFTDADDGHARLVATVDETLAKRFLAGRNPVGMQVSVDAKALEIVGVAGSAKYFGLEEDPIPTLYVPIYQVQPGYVSFLTAGISVVVRSPLEGRALADQIRNDLRLIDGDVPAGNIRTLEDSLEAALAPRRFNMFVLGAFACASMLLAAVGLYAVVSSSVSEQIRELAIRSALGASHRHLLFEVMSGSLRQVGIGVAVGIAGALTLAPVVSRLLFQVDALDGETFAMVAAVLVASGGLASYLPARRAADADPAKLLRSE